MLEVLLGQAWFLFAVIGCIGLAGLGVLYGVVEFLKRIGVVIDE